MIEIASNIMNPTWNDEVMSIWRGWVNTREYYDRRLRREIENWRFYWAHDPELGMGQWPEKVVGMMLQQNRQLLTYNFIMPIVDQIAGGIVKLPYDPEFYPVNSKISTLTHAIKKAMYVDKELMDWNSTYFQMVRAGLVHEAVIKMDISDEYDDLGNICFKNTLPGSTMASPLWKTQASRDCEMCYHESWFTAEQMAEFYPEHAERLIYEIDQMRRSGTEYGSFGGITPYMQEDGMWGSAHRLIQQYRMVKRVVQRDYVVTEEGEIPIPDEIPQENRCDWLNEYIPDWQPDLVYTKPEKEKVCIVRAICPTLTKFDILENRPTKIQIGRLPFYWWSASRANGESHSIVDSVKDIQMNINYWESMITHKLQIDGGGGSQFIDRQKFVSEAEASRYVTERNNPGAVFTVKPGALDRAGNIALPTLKANFPTEAYEHLNHLIGVILPHISKAPPASKGLAEGPVQSGRLYDMLRQTADQQLVTIHEGLRIFWNEVYEGYLMQAAEQYSIGMLPRTFSYNKGQDSITLNEEVTYPDGRRGIKNDVRQLKFIRHKVIISETQQSPTEKVESIDAISRLIQSIPKGKPATIQYLINRVAELYDQLNEEDREALSIIGEKELGVAIAELEAMEAEAKVRKIQALMALQPPPPPQAPQEVQADPQGLLPGQPIQPQQPQPQAVLPGEPIPQEQPQVAEGVPA